jgi:Protein of unknown function (DUF3102)
MATKRRNTRSLADVAEDLDKLHLSHNKNLLEKGRLLSEARQFLVEHGDWGDWVDEHCPYSERSALNYRNAFEFTEKFGISETIADLKISPGAIYEMVSMDSRYPEAVMKAVVAAVLKAAKKAGDKWIDDFDVGNIRRDIEEAESIKEQAQAEGKTVAQVKAERIAAEAQRVAEWEAAEAQRVTEWEASQAQREAERVATLAQATEDRLPSKEDLAEANGILDGPPPEVPPPAIAPPPSADDFLPSTLIELVGRLDRLVTKPLVRFAETAVPPDQLERVAQFLLGVAARIKERQRPAA